MMKEDDYLIFYILISSHRFIMTIHIIGKTLKKLHIFFLKCSFHSIKLYNMVTAHLLKTGHKCYDFFVVSRNCENYKNIMISGNAAEGNITNLFNCSLFLPGQTNTIWNSYNKNHVDIFQRNWIWDRLWINSVSIKSRLE